MNIPYIHTFINFFKLKKKSLVQIFFMDCNDKYLDELILASI